MILKPRKSPDKPAPTRSELAALGHQYRSVVHAFYYACGLGPRTPSCCRDHDLDPDSRGAALAQLEGFGHLATACASCRHRLCQNGTTAVSERTWAERHGGEPAGLYEPPAPKRGRRLDPREPSVMDDRTRALVDWQRQRESFVFHCQLGLRGDRCGRYERDDGSRGAALEGQVPMTIPPCWTCRHRKGGSWSAQIAEEVWADSHKAPTGGSEGPGQEGAT